MYWSIGVKYWSIYVVGKEAIVSYYITSFTG